MAKGVHLRYNLSTGLEELENVISEIQRIEEGKKCLLEDEEISCISWLYSGRPAVRVDIYAVQKYESLEPAVKSFIAKVGIPHFIEGSSDWSICDRALQEYGFQTKRILIFGLFGREIERIK